MAGVPSMKAGGSAGAQSRLWAHPLALLSLITLIRVVDPLGEQLVTQVAGLLTTLVP